MLCSKCGTLNSEEAAFCKNCGASLITQDTQPTEENQDEVTYPAISTIKKIASSGLFMAGAICLSIFAFLQFISAFSGSFMFKYVETMMDLTGAYHYETAMIDGFFDIMGTVFTSASLIGLIPVVLAVIGVWLFYSATKKNEPVNTKGLRILKGTIIYEIVILSVVDGLILLLIVACIAILGSNVAFLGQSLNIPQYVEGIGAVSTGVLVFIFSLVFIILAASFIINLLVYIKALKTVNDIKETFESGIFFGKVSMYLIVMLFVMGASSALSFSLTGISLGAAYIIFGVCLNQLREEFSRAQVKPEFPEF